MNINIKEITEALKKFNEIEFAYIFGSHASGRATNLSDLDIAVYINNFNSPDEFIKYPYGFESAVTGNLSIIIKSDKIDLVLLNKVDILLSQKIINTGILLFERNKLSRVKVENNIRYEFIDTEHYRRLRAKKMKVYINVPQPGY